MDFSNLTVREAYLVGLLIAAVRKSGPHSRRGYKGGQGCRCNACVFADWFEANMHALVNP